MFIVLALAACFVVSTDNIPSSPDTDATDTDATDTDTHSNDTSDTDTQLPDQDSDQDSDLDDTSAPIIVSQVCQLQVSGEIQPFSACFAGVCGGGEHAAFKASAELAFGTADYCSGGSGTAMTCSWSAHGFSVTNTYDPPPDTGDPSAHYGASWTITDPACTTSQGNGIGSDAQEFSDELASWSEYDDGNEWRWGEEDDEETNWFVVTMDSGGAVTKVVSKHIVHEGGA